MHHGHQQLSRESLVTRGIPASKIPGLVSCDNATFSEEMKELEELTKPSYTHDEMFANWVTYVQHIEAPIEAVYEYLANPYSVEEFTATLRKIEYCGGGVYRGIEMLAPNTYTYIRIEAYADARVIDSLCAWDQGLELWMRYHMRLLDAQVTIGKPGTLLLWNNCRHPYYDKASAAPPYVAEPRSRTDRMWVGDFWRFFYAAHHIEARNLKRILEYRFRAGQG